MLPDPGELEQPLLRTPGDSGQPLLRTPGEPDEPLLLTPEETTQAGPEVSSFLSVLIVFSSPGLKTIVCYCHSNASGMCRMSTVENILFKHLFCIKSLDPQF